MSSVSTPRQFIAPGGSGLSLTLDEMEMFEHAVSPLGDWCRRTLAVERDKTLDAIGAVQYLPRGVVDTSADAGILVASLVNRSGQIWGGSEWVWPDEPVDMDATVDMDDAAVAFVARAQMEGADAVLFRESIPRATLYLVAAGEDDANVATTLDTLPEGSIVVAIVDGMDRGAVLELLAVTPDTAVFKRHDGTWVEDREWLSVLKSVKPPPMVKIEPDMLPSVAQQVDEATAGTDFRPFKSKDDTDKYVTASAHPYIHELRREADAAMVASNIALLAVAGREISPKDVASTERLKRYWLYGKGAAKIRWGTPGSWRRCYRHLVKYMGPHMTPGYCTNLSQRLGGQGIATHVGTKAKRKAKKVLKGN